MAADTHASHDSHDAHNNDAHRDDGAVHVHIASTRFYVGIFVALICLTIATVKVSYYDFGSANIIIAILIATMKASLVAAFFMHLRHDNLFNTLSFLAAFLFLGLFILFTYDDIGVRAHYSQGYVQRMNPATGQAAPGGEPATSATVDDVSEHGGEAPPHGAGHEKKE
jgi:cytochrome c oxidase subunit 4